MKLPALTSAAALACMMLALSGCAPRLDKAGMTREAAGIESSAREGQLVARQVTKGATLGTTTRVRMEDLTGAASESGAKLAESTASPKLERQAQQLSTIAGKVSDSLDELYRHPTDKTVARRVDHDLGALARQAHKYA